MHATLNSRRAGCYKLGGCYLKFYLQKGSSTNFAFLCELKIRVTISVKKTEVEKCENNKMFYGGISVYGISLASASCL